MSIILGLTALFVAFIALWVASEALKGTRKSSEAILRAQTVRFSEAMSTTNAMVNALTERLARLEEDMAKLSESKAASRKALTDMERRKRLERTTEAASSDGAAANRQTRTGTG